MASSMVLVSKPKNNVKVAKIRLKIWKSDFSIFATLTLFLGFEISTIESAMVDLGG